MRVLVFVLLLSLPALCNAGQVYKWRDKDGNIHYSDVEPPKQDAQRKNVKNKNPKAMTPEELAAKAKADKLAAKKASCDQSKQNVATITDSKYAKITMDIDGDGKPDELTPAQRASQTEVLKAVVTVNCSQ